MALRETPSPPPPCSRAPPFSPPTRQTQHSISGTKEEFIGGARKWLLSLGVTGLVLALFSVVGPCLLSSVLLGKIRNLEEGRERRDGEKRFVQLRRSAHEANALCTLFACVCTG